MIRAIDAQAVTMRRHLFTKPPQGRHNLNQSAPFSGSATMTRPGERCFRGKTCFRAKDAATGDAIVPGNGVNAVQLQAAGRRYRSVARRQGTLLEHFSLFPNRHGA
jgi:hypothetical protein